MKLKPTKKGLQGLVSKQKEQEVIQKEEPKKEFKKRENKLPPDGYKPMFEPIKILVRETHSSKDPTKVIKQYVELKVMRYNDDEGLPFAWISMYQESEFYTGYLKGKTVYFPLEMLYDVVESLNDLSEECDKRNIE